MNKLLEFLSGKKTYLVALVIGVTAAAQHLGIMIPEYVFQLLAAFGLAAVRDGVNK